MPIEVLQIENAEGNMVFLNDGDHITSRKEEGSNGHERNSSDHCDGGVAAVVDKQVVGRMEDLCQEVVCKLELLLKGVRFVVILLR